VKHIVYVNCGLLWSIRLDCVAEAVALNMLETLIGMVPVGEAYDWEHDEIGDTALSSKTTTGAGEV